jgi:hypothetical protein
MNEQDVRALVREAIERHLGRPGQGARSEGQGVSPTTLHPSHPSHIILNVASGGEVDDGMCVIEPRVRCSHCGFCQSYGH